MPAQPAIEARGDGLAGQKLRAQPGALHLLRQVSRPACRKAGVGSQRFRHFRLGDVQERGGLGRHTVAVIMSGIERCFRQQRSGERPLQDQYAAILLVSQERYRPLLDEIKRRHRVAAAKELLAFFEAATARGHLLEDGKDRLGHDRYHVQMRRSETRSPLPANEGKIMRRVGLALPVLIASIWLSAAYADREHRSPYAGEEA